MRIDIEQVLGLAKEKLLLTGTTQADPILTKYINMAAKRLDTRDTYIVSCETVDIDCDRAKLPDAATEIIAFRLLGPNGSCSGCCAGNPNVTPGTLGINMDPACGCPMWYVANRNVLTNWNGLGGSCGYYGGFFSFDVQAGEVRFPTTVTATQMTVYYRGWNTDENNLMILDEETEDALASFAAVNYATSHIDKYSREQRYYWQQTWVKQKGVLRGAANVKDTNLHKATLSAIMNAQFVNPLIALNQNV